MVRYDAEAEADAYLRARQGMPKKDSMVALLRAAHHRGAEEMRERAAARCERAGEGRVGLLPELDGEWTHCAKVCAGAIRALPTEPGEEAP